MTDLPAPMLAQLARALPEGDYFYEPKWDGLRCVAAVDGERAELQSRHGRGLTRYFPEVARALVALGRRVVVDGELVIIGAGGFDFGALLNRTHPAASRVERLARETPATLILFDLLALDGEDLMDRPFAERRDALAAVIAGAPPTLQLTPCTDDADVARQWLMHFSGHGIDGVVAKARALTYQPNRRAMIKVKRERTADCVLAGFRWSGDTPTVASLLLGLWDGEVLRHVGIASSFSGARKAALAVELEPLIVPLAGHPWEQGFGLERSPIGRLPGSAGRWSPTEMTMDWVPLSPQRVCEVAYDHLDGRRFRHPAKLVRWRPDRDPRSCTFDQLEPSDGKSS